MGGAMCAAKVVKRNGLENMGESSGTAAAILAALVGGAWGGAMVGLAEAVLITVTSGPGEEYWLFPYAVASYGALGALIGLGCAAVGWVARAVVRRHAGRRLFGMSAALSIFLLGMAVARYNVNQRVFHEQLETTSATGLAVHLGLLVVAGALALAVLSAGRLLQQYRRGVIFAACAFVLCLGLTSGAAVLASPHTEAPLRSRAASANAAQRPNIILIIADTLRADAVGVFGAPPNATPEIDRFAAEAERFANTYSQSTWTRPSIATILTSLYPSGHGLMHKLDALPDRVTTLAEALRADGYWTAGFVSNINVAPVFNFQQGFEEYTYLAPDFYFWASDSATRLAVYKGLRVVRERFFADRIYFNHYYQDAAVVDAAVTHWLEQRPPSPFFLLIHYMDPHDPYFEQPYNGHGVARVNDPDPAPARRDELHRLYGEDVTYLDGYFGTLVAQLKTRGLYDNSVIALAADHGEEFQEHGGWWHGTTLYQEQMHVPLIIKRAREAHGGAVETHIARTLDIAPTLMVAAGLAPPREFVGRDLFGSVAPDGEPLFAEEDLEGNVLSALRIGPWKLITANPGNPRGLQTVELYNLDQDSQELHNVAASEPTRTQDMLRQLARQRAQLSTASTDYVVDHRS
jgi:arylsulfatase A-like enzyme